MGDQALADFQHQFCEVLGNILVPLKSTQAKAATALAEEIRKYGDVDYSVYESINDDEIEILVSYNTYGMDDNSKGIIDDTKMILKMLIF